MTAEIRGMGAGASLVEPSLLETRDLTIYSTSGGGRRVIVRDLTLEVASGETIGIVGESGSGKSMTAKALISLLPAGVRAEGTIRYRGEELLGLSERRLSTTIRGREIGLVFQDPFTSLNPLRTCGDQIVETLRDERGRSLRGTARHSEAARRLAEVGIRDPAVVSRFPFQLSGGMRQRVCIAAALARDPNLLIADEPSTALDVTTQREILALIKSLQESRRMGLVLITHDLRVAFSMCDRVYVLYAGSLLEVGGADAVAREPLHPYTLALLMSEPPVDRRVRELVAIPGRVPPADEVSDCCAFAPRCRWAEEQCRQGHPDLQVVEPHRLSSCVRISQIRRPMREMFAVSAANVPSIGHDGASATLVQVSDLRKIFEVGGRSRLARRVAALDGVSIDIGVGESVGIVGESGSGKSTLARCLVGLETPTSGDIIIDGIRANDFGKVTHEDLRRLRQTVQIVFQDPYSSLNPTRTIGATLLEALHVAGVKSQETGTALERLLTAIGLPFAYARRKPVALSGGERQRVAIARALAVRPRLLVCDEPVSALDVSVQAQILNILKALRADQGMAYLFITHDLAVVRQVVERVYVMHNGVVVEQGPVDDVLDHPKHAYTAALVESLPRAEANWLAVPRAHGA